MIDVSIIIVNYNTGKLIKNCIDSVLSQTDINCEIIVVDNASYDESVNLITQYQDKLTLIPNLQNVGFGRANNQAAKIARGEFLFLLNPDAIFEHTSALRQMLDYMRENPQIGLAGTQVIKTKKGGYSIPQTLYPAQKYTALNFSALPGNIAWVIGASMMVCHDVFAQVHGFDEDFFLYGEEADLCLRIRKAGFEIGYNPAVVVAHVGGASEQATPSAEIWRKKQNGLHLFMKKNYPPREIEKILAVHIRRAKRRLFFLALREKCGLLDENKKNTYIRYQVVLETSKNFLRALESVE